MIDKEQLIDELEEHLMQVKNSTLGNPFIYMENIIREQCKVSCDHYADYMFYLSRLRIDLAKIDRS